MQRNTRRLASVAALLLGTAYAWYSQGDRSAPIAERPATDGQLAEGIVTIDGVVDRVLADDRDGSRHQRFIVRLASGSTVLVAHNIDLAPRVDNIEVGARIRLHGEYVSNERGGVVHWTHQDPAGRHPAGYIEYGGRRYQ